jgi:hypothetical protein
MTIVARALRPLLPWIRLAAFVLVVGAVFLALGVRRVRADIVEAGMAFGDTLEGLGDVLPRPYVVHLNGQRAFVASATLDESPSAALDRVEGLCRAHDGGFTDSLAEVARREGFEPPTPGAALPILGVLRTDRPSGGLIACFAQAHRLGLGEIATRVERIAADGDLGHLGHLRYASARRTASGRTHLVVVWTNGPFAPVSAFPSSGDAPGSDVAGVGKPAGTRRVLTAAIEGTPYAVRVYHTQNDSAPLDDYGERLRAGGFAEDALSRDVGVHSYRRGAEELIVRGEPSRRGGAVLSVVSTGVRAADSGGHAP